MRKNHSTIAAEQEYQKIITELIPEKTAIYYVVLLLFDASFGLSSFNNISDYEAAWLLIDTQIMKKTDITIQCNGAGFSDDPSSTISISGRGILDFFLTEFGKKMQPFFDSKFKNNYINIPDGFCDFLRDTHTNIETNPNWRTEAKQKQKQRIDKLEANINDMIKKEHNGFDLLQALSRETDLAQRQRKFFYFLCKSFNFAATEGFIPKKNIEEVIQKINETSVEISPDEISKFFSYERSQPNNDEENKKKKNKKIIIWILCIVGGTTTIGFCIYFFKKNKRKKFKNKNTLKNSNKKTKINLGAEAKDILLISESKNQKSKNRESKNPKSDNNESENSDPENYPQNQ